MPQEYNEARLFDVMYSCRAMRRLRPDPVPENLLIQLIDAANQAPSGSNLQGARWVLVRDAAQKAELAKLNYEAVQAYIQPQLASLKDLPQQSADKRRRMMNAVLWQADHLQEMPVLIIACHQFEGPVDRLQAAQAAGSVWPGVQNLLLAARALELGAAPTTLGLTRRSEVKRILNLPENVEAYCLIPVGYPKGRFGPVTRLPVEQTMYWDRWD